MPALALLAFAILFEVTGTVMLRVSDGMSKLWPSLAVVAFYCASFYILSLVLRELQIGFAYAIWAGAGTAIVAVVGVLAWGEPVNAIKVASIVAVIAGVIGLNVAGAH